MKTLPGLALSRRGLLAGGGAATALAALGALPSWAQSRGEVRFGIFGNAEKLRLRGESVARYAELNPDLKVVYEGVPSDAWPDKIAAMIAGGTAPDVIALSVGDTEQFASRGALAPLDDYAPSPFRTDLFDPTVLDLGRYDGKIYGVPIAVSIQGVGYNQSALDRLGMDAPPESWSYDDYATRCAEIHKADPNLYGSHDFAARLDAFVMYLLASGRQLYDGRELAVSVDDVAQWLNYWNEMRASGGAVPADLQAQFTGTEWPNSPLVRGTAVFAMMASQDLAGGYQALTKDTLGITTPPAPTAGGNPGCYPRPTSSLSLNARSDNPEEAVKLIDWFVSDPESAKILGLISGPPASKPALAAVLELEGISEVDAKVLAYAQGALANALPAPPAQRAERAMTDLMRRVNENVGFGKSSVREGAEEFVEQAAATLRRA
jgi:multiple sugar transport system substrate-binding protein